MSKLLSAVSDATFPDFDKHVEKAFRLEGVRDSEGFVRVKTERNDGIYFSPSSFGKCLREIYYSMTSALNAVAEADVDVKFLRVCQTGSDMHKHYQNTMFWHRKLAGHYACTKCGTVHDDQLYLCPDECPDCKAERFLLRYKEARFNDHDEKVRFKPDGWLVRATKSSGYRLHYVDFKSMNTYKFKSLVKSREVPLPHVQQINFYRCHRPKVRFMDGWLTVDPVSVMIYEDKNTQERCVLPVPMDQEQYAADLDNVRFIHKSIARGKPPRRANDSGMCKWCPHVEACKD